MPVPCIASFAAHPDDAEISSSGTLLAMKADGYRTGIVNLTRGELGTRGTPEVRDLEARQSADTLGLDFHFNLGLPDGGVLNTPEQRLVVISAIRHTRPHIILCNAISDRHPDHGNAATLVKEAAFLSGLRNIVTYDTAGNQQEPFRPRLVLHYIQDTYLKPDLVVDITPYMEKRMEAIKAFKTQFYDPESKEPETYISTPAFFEGFYSRAREMGRYINVPYAEGFVGTRPIGITSLAHLL